MKRALNITFVLALVAGTVSTQAAQAPQAQPPAAGAAPAGRGGGGGGAQRAPLTPKIVNFEATPASLKPGESFVLSWTTESGAATIDNGIGSVYARGATKITPKATSTYTLSMGNGAVTKSVTVTVAGTTPIAPAAANAAAALKPIARIDGKPDFSGIYGFTGMASLGGGGRGAAGAAAAPAPPASPFANLPATPTLKPGVKNTAIVNPAGGTSDCLPLPAETAWGVPYPFQIFQNKNHMVIINEYPGTFRIIPIGEPHPADADPSWMGDSVGSWDGDTFVIDTIAYNGKHSIGGRGASAIQQPSEKFHTIERLTRTSASNIFYEIIFEDPEVATGQWRTTQTFTGDTRPGVVKIMEFICENNRDYIPLFGPAGPAPAGEGRGGRGQ